MFTAIKKAKVMFSYIYMKILESSPKRYDTGINLASLGHAQKMIEQIVVDFVKPGIDVLDIGCGTGALAIKASKKGARVVGIDISSEMLSVAHKKVSREGVGDLVILRNIGVLDMDQELKDKSFDLAVSTLVFSELSPDERMFVLRECHRLIRDDGVLVVADETEPQGMIKRILYRLLRFPLSLATFIIAQTGTKAVPDLEGIIECAGYKVIRSQENHLGSFTLVAAEKTEVPVRKPERKPVSTPLWKKVFAPIMEYLFRWFPFPVQTGIRWVGHPDRESPVLVTANYSLTEKRLKKGLGGLDCYLLLANTRGVNPWCASAEGNFNAHEVASVIKSSRIGELVDHQTLILPQLCAPGVSKRDVSKLTGWKARFGPVYAKDIPEYIRCDFQKNPVMHIYEFNPRTGLDLAISMSFIYYLLLFIPILIFRREKLGRFSLLFWSETMTVYLFFKKIPTRFGWSKALITGSAFATGIAAIDRLVLKERKVPYGWILSALGLSAALGIDLGGMTGVLKDEPLLLANKLGIKKIGPFNVHEMGRIHLDLEKCVGCGSCYDVCPRGVYAIDKSAGKTRMVNPDKCEMCKACIKQCPEVALTLE